MIMLGTSGVGVFLAMPVMAAAMSSELGAGEASIGQFSTIQLVALSAGCLLSTFMSSTNLRRNGLCALLVMMVCDLACLLQPEWAVFLALRAVGGAAGGVAVSQATAAMGQTDHPERNFGLFLATQTLGSIACIYLMPPIVAASSFFGAYGVLLALEAIAAIFVLRLLGGIRIVRDGGAEGGNDSARWIGSFAMLASIMCFFIGVGAIWTFLALLGQRIGLQPAAIAMVLSVSQIVAFAASFLPGFLLPRIGRLVPMTACVVLLVVAVATFRLAGDLTLFATATVLFICGWYVLYPFQLGTLGIIDRDGRPMLAAAALTGAGLGTGPALAILFGGGLAGITLVSLGAFVLAGLFAVFGLRKGVRRRSV